MRSVHLCVGGVYLSLSLPLALPFSVCATTRCVHSSAAAVCSTTRRARAPRTIPRMWSRRRRAASGDQSGADEPTHTHAPTCTHMHPHTCTCTHTHTCTHLVVPVAQVLLRHFTVAILIKHALDVTLQLVPVNSDVALWLHGCAG